MDPRESKEPTPLDVSSLPRRIVFDDVLSAQECEELAFIHASSSTVGYRPHVCSTTLSHLIAANCAPLMLPILPIRDRIRDKVEEAFGMQLGLFIEFTGLISWLPGASIGWHADDNRPYLKQRAFAAVCYLNEYGKDFDGGLFRFREGHPHSVAPKPGRLVAYSASGENEHCVDPVIRGQRLTLTLWFTLNPAHSEDSSLLSLLSRIPLSLRPPFPHTSLNPTPMGDVGPGRFHDDGENAEVEVVSEGRDRWEVVSEANQRGKVGTHGLGENGRDSAPKGNVEERSRGDGGTEGSKRRRVSSLLCSHCGPEGLACLHREREDRDEAVLVPIPLLASDSLYIVQKEGQGGEGEAAESEVGGGVQQGGRESDREEQGGREVDIRVQELASMGWRAAPFVHNSCSATIGLPPGRDDAGLRETESEWVVLVPVLAHELRDGAGPCPPWSVSNSGEAGTKMVKKEKDTGEGKERKEIEAAMSIGCIDRGEMRGKCDSGGGGADEQMDSSQKEVRVPPPVLFFNILHALQVAAFHRWRTKSRANAGECCINCGKCEQCERNSGCNEKISWRGMLDAMEPWKMYMKGLTRKFQESSPKWQADQILYDCL
ncbi:hypothetical protein CLOM_g16783 [Closterium sp. NIES-68]|nr:hypothetical protein CLOM_g16783 [Closterium sp. NIES-68]